MRYALVNPNWTFDGSIYFGCREPHLPLEYGYAKALLERAGHEGFIIDGQLRELSRGQIKTQLSVLRPDVTVITTAPSYLFWRCAPPELRVPQQTVRDLRDVGGIMVAVGPHGSSTPRAALRKLGVDVIVMGECEELLPHLANGWKDLDGVCYWENGGAKIQGKPQAVDFAKLPALRWPSDSVQRHTHHHHRFEARPAAPGAEVEASRGCPYHCSFCAKDDFRNAFRRRPVPVVLEEVDGLLGQGVDYIYFIDEIFLPNQELLEALVDRPVKFGVQTRIDLWNCEMLDLLGEAGCVSIEAGVESITKEGRNLLDKHCRLTTDELADRLVYAKRRVPFVQANLIQIQQDDPEAVEDWRQYLQHHNVWANKPVPLFPYPGSPDYMKRWGLPDDRAWERAHQHYLEVFDEFSDVQDQQPLPLEELELSAVHG